MSQRKIARRLGVNSSTISRELRRNTTATGYEPDTAHRLGAPSVRMSVAPSDTLFL